MCKVAGRSAGDSSVGQQRLLAAIASYSEKASGVSRTVIGLGIAGSLQLLLGNLPSRGLPRLRCHAPGKAQQRGTSASEISGRRSTAGGRPLHDQNTRGCWWDHQLGAKVQQIAYRQGRCAWRRGARLRVDRPAAGGQAAMGDSSVAMPTDRPGRNSRSTARSTSWPPTSGQLLHGGAKARASWCSTQADRRRHRADDLRIKDGRKLPGTVPLRVVYAVTDENGSCGLPSTPRQGDCVTSPRTRSSIWRARARETCWPRRNIQADISHRRRVADPHGEIRPVEGTPRIHPNPRRLARASSRRRPAEARHRYDHKFGLEKIMPADRRSARRRAGYAALGVMINSCGRSRCRLSWSRPARCAAPSARFGEVQGRTSTG